MKRFTIVIGLALGCTAMDAPPGSGNGGAAGAGSGGTTGSNQLDIYQSGTRIKLRVGTTPDGAKTFLGWHDAQRSEHCNFYAAADGTRRCLPVFDQPSAALDASVFSDAQCTMQLARAATNMTVLYAYKL